MESDPQPTSKMVRSASEPTAIRNAFSKASSCGSRVSIGMWLWMWRGRGRETTQVIHDVPHVGRACARLAVQSLHNACGADTVADVDKDLAFGRTVVPLVVGEIGWFRMAGLHELRSFFTIALARHAMTLGAIPVVNDFAGLDGF